MLEEINFEEIESEGEVLEGEDLEEEDLEEEDLKDEVFVGDNLLGEDFEGEKMEGEFFRPRKLLFRKSLILFVWGKWLNPLVVGFAANSFSDFASLFDSFPDFLLSLVF